MIKRTFNKFANRFGFELIRIPKFSATDSRYEVVLPNATYSPWKVDSAFQEAHAATKGYTMVDKYRCYELWKLVEQVSKLKTGSLIEIGVWRGGTGALIAKQAKICGINDKIFLCDTFADVVKAGEKDSLYKNGEHADTSTTTVKEILTKLNLDNVELLQGIFPDQTSKRVEDLQFRFCHVDVDVYQSAKDVVEWVWDKMIPGGIIVYDDYGFYGCDGITKYVNEQMKMDDRMIFHNLNGHAIIVKL